MIQRGPLKKYLYQEKIQNLVDIQRNGSVGLHTRPKRERYTLKSVMNCLKKVHFVHLKKLVPYNTVVISTMPRVRQTYGIQYCKVRDVHTIRDTKKDCQVQICIHTGMTIISLNCARKNSLIVA